MLTEFNLSKNFYEASDYYEPQEIEVCYSSSSGCKAMSSPDPTIEPAKMSPGPKFLIIPRGLLGGF